MDKVVLEYHPPDEIAAAIQRVRSEYHHFLLPGDRDVVFLLSIAEKHTALLQEHALMEAVVAAARWTTNSWGHAGCACPLTCPLCAAIIRLDTMRGQS